MSSARPSRRFSRQVFGAFAVLLLTVTVVLTTNSVFVQKQRMERALVDRSVGLAGVLSSSARVAVYAENAESVREILLSVVGLPDVQSASIFTSDRRLVAAVERSPGLTNAAGTLSPTVVAVAERLGPERGCLTQESAERIETVCPVLLQESRMAPMELYVESAPDPGWKAIGVARVVFDRGALRRDVGRLILGNFALMVIILAFGGWAGFHFARRVTEPLERLTEAAHAVGAGNRFGELSPMPDNEIGRLARAFTKMTDDLSERAREKEALAERLQHAQKMEAVGALSQGIAHDFKNILSTLKIAVHLLERGSLGNDSVLKYTGRMQTTLERARELVERLLSFSRPRELQFGVVDLDALLNRLVPTFRTVLGDRVTLQVEPSGSPVPVCGDPTSLEQLLMNLVYNARDAMPDGGAVSVRLEVRPAAAGATPFARISVRDTGVGMEPQMRERIFEPFFTTKGPGTGTGLGLSIVRGIVEEHRGSIDVESAPGAGTTFHVDLPLAQPSAAAGSPGGEGGAA